MEIPIKVWRGSLLPLGCEAPPKPDTATYLKNRAVWMGAAVQPSGSKLPRHGLGAAHKRGADGYCAGLAFIFSAIFLSTASRIWSMLKLAGFWLGGYSMNVSRNFADLVTATAPR